MFRLIASLFLLSSLSGCFWMLLPKASSNVYNFSGETYLPRTNGRPIPILENEKPTRPFVRIARIEAWAMIGRDEDGFEELRRRAMELGADAIIDFNRTDRTVETSTTRIRESEKKQYDWNSAETEREKTIDSPRRYTQTIFTGVAIRYKDAP